MRTVCSSKYISFSAFVDAAYAVEILEKLRRVALQRQNKSAAVKLAQLIAILESPLYNRIVTVQKSLEKLSDIQVS